MHGWHFCRKSVMMALIFTVSGEISWNSETSGIMPHLPTLMTVHCWKVLFYFCLFVWFCFPRECDSGLVACLNQLCPLCLFLSCHMCLATFQNTQAPDTLPWISNDPNLSVPLCLTQNILSFMFPNREFCQSPTDTSSLRFKLSWPKPPWHPPATYILPTGQAGLGSQGLEPHSCPAVMLNHQPATANHITGTQHWLTVGTSNVYAEGTGNSKCDIWKFSDFLKYFPHIEERILFCIQEVPRTGN